MKALLFGSIGTLAETSGLQHDCFNAAFAAHGLDWHCSMLEYRSLLKTAGGIARIETYARQLDQSVDAAAIHATKSELFQQRLETGVALRPGVATTIARCQAAGTKVALVTTTSAANVRAIMAATGLSKRDFDLIVTRDDIQNPKPSPDAFQSALRLLALKPGDALAIEDNPDGYA
ncbi:MAG: HAD-IA family hydrolase, partial [Pseudomonadota bacterium]